jgi:hypothetical protein
MYSFALVYILFLLKGPEQMVPYLMELVCTVIPVQCMLYAVAALRNDYDREKGDKATVGGKNDWTGGKSSSSTECRYPARQRSPTTVVLCVLGMDSVSFGGRHPQQSPVAS